MSTAVQITLSLLFIATSWGVKSERIQKVSDFFEIFTNGINLIYDIFHAFDSIKSQSLFDDFVFDQRNSLSIEFSKSSFIDQAFDSFSRRISISDIWLDSS